MDDKIVESEIGEQWSPNTDPAKTAPITGNIHSGWMTPIIETLIGIIMANVPHDVPVAKAITQDNKKKMTGIIHNGTRSCTRLDRKTPVSNCSIIWPTDQANIKIKTAVIIFPTPLKKTGKKRCQVIFLLGIYKTAAVIIAKIPPYTRANTILPSPEAVISPFEEVKNPPE